MRLVDADVLRDEILYDNTYDNDTVNYYLGLIDDAPTVEPTPCARWKGEGFGDYRCSLCDEAVSGEPNYCPNGGAKMAYLTEPGREKTDGQ